jgi:hypothetical protein
MFAELIAMRISFRMFLGCLLVVTCATPARLFADDHSVSSRPESPSSALTHYVTLRLTNADWDSYSKLITWPDEPSWDCKWVTTSYMLGALRKAADNVVIPVTYDRLGLYCSDFDLQLHKASVQVEYHLVMESGAWKVSAPVPDYPDIGVATLLRSLTTSGNSSNESAERRRQFKDLVQKLHDAETQGVAGHP